MNRRKEIELDDAERTAYLAAAHTIILTSVGSDGFPHVVPMWFTVDDDGCFYMTTFRRAQKTLNLRRNPKATLLVESGVEYQDLKGVMTRGTAEVIDDDPTLCTRVLSRIYAKHNGSITPEVEEVLQAQAAKRSVLKITPTRTSSWDHRKLGGRY
jgi:PPOX class probable F420-dependent enzyme